MTDMELVAVVQKALLASGLFPVQSFARTDDSVGNGELLTIDTGRPSAEQVSVWFTDEMQDVARGLQIYLGGLRESGSDIRPLDNEAATPAPRNLLEEVRSLGNAIRVTRARVDLAAGRVDLTIEPTGSGVPTIQVPLTIRNLTINGTMNMQGDLHLGQRDADDDDDSDWDDYDELDEDA